MATKSHKLPLCLAMFLAGSLAARAQSALDGFDPNANDSIRSVVLQPDGKILIAGDFTTLAPNGGVSVTRNHIARLNPNGTLDTAFNPNANMRIFDIALQLDGKIVVGGEFTTIGGQQRNRIARLDPATGLADSFDPDANSPVHCVGIQADGRILAGGYFSGENSIGGQTRNRIARLDPVSGTADSFDPNANELVETIAVLSNGKILVGGYFTNIGGQTRHYFARLDPGSGLGDSFDPDANDAVLAFAVQVDGRILVGGFFTNIGGQLRNRIARLDPATGLADSFNPNATAAVWELTVQPDGKIIVGGSFNGANSIGGEARNCIARLDPFTGAADSFNPNANNAVLAMALQADGKIVVGGHFIGVSSLGGQNRNGIARLESDGKVDRTLNLNVQVGPFGGSVSAIAVQPDGKILIGGSFDSVLGYSNSNIARLHSDGTLDPAFSVSSGSVITAIAVQADGKILLGSQNGILRFNANGSFDSSFNLAANGSVLAIAVQADGKILAGGEFTQIGGQTRHRIARLDPSSGLADSFNPHMNDAVLAIAIQADGKVLAVGEFTSAGAGPVTFRNHIARFDPASGAYDSFAPNANMVVNAIVIQADGKILAGGEFTNIAGVTRNRIARLNPNGSADSFNPNASGPGSTSSVFALAVQTDGKIVAGGYFTNIGGQSRNYIARLNPSTGLADSFNPSAENRVSGLALQADGKILAAGTFSSIGGQTRNLFARLTNDTIVQQSLTVSQTTVSWTRSGAGPHFTRVTFEDSTNGVDYNFLGHGTASGSDWTLTGLNLSTGQNLYIRARGYYHTGRRNGSESSGEAVRNAWLFLPTALEITAVTHLADGHVFIRGKGVPNELHTMQAAADLNPASFAPLLPAVAADAGGNWQFTDTTTPVPQRRFYRLTFP